MWNMSFCNIYNFNIKWINYIRIYIYKITKKQQYKSYIKFCESKQIYLEKFQFGNLFNFYHVFIKYK